MSALSRRHFLSNTLAAGASLGGCSLFGKGPATPPSEAGVGHITIDPDRTISTLDRNLFGSFIEHLGRAVYEGIYEPGSKFADGNGFRTDVLKAIQELGVPV